MTSMTSAPAYLLPGVPISQPPHLEGDPAFATEILPGPPSLVSVQQSAHRRDPKKLTTVVSYLPASDPGSTYSGLMAGSMGGLEVDGPRRKRARIDKSSATGRAQRASARNLNGATLASDTPMATEMAGPSSMPPMPDSDTIPMAVDSDEPSISRSNSALNLEEGTSASVSGRAGVGQKDKGRGKGKGKEVERASSRMIEDQIPGASFSPGPGPALLNEDHCSSCLSLGSLVYCDGCPRAFHLWCLDPPMEAVDLPEGDATWLCPACTIRKNPPPKPSPSFMSPLVYQALTCIPTEYQLPDDIRQFFKDVSTGPRGAYVDGSEMKQPRLNRHGQLEDRDPYRLKDRNGAPVLCFKCEMTALPGGLAAIAPATKRARRLSPKVNAEKWNNMVSCDYCGLHWHLDCLDPPLSSMPSFGKKWMCPNHAEQVLQSKRRIPKHNAPPIEITKPGQFNNGNIEVILPRIAPDNLAKAVAVEEVLINGRRYRVPERVIVLDFWSKVRHQRQSDDPESDRLSAGLSSPLTSLSSLEDHERYSQNVPESPSRDVEELRVAQLLCGLRDLFKQDSLSLRLALNGSKNKMVDNSTQTELEEGRSRILDFPKSNASVKHGGSSKKRNNLDIAPSTVALDISSASSLNPQQSNDNVRTSRNHRKLERKAKLAGAEPSSSLESVHSNTLLTLGSSPRRNTAKRRYLVDTTLARSMPLSTDPQRESHTSRRSRDQGTIAAAQDTIKREDIKTDAEMLEPPTLSPKDKDTKGSGNPARRRKQLPNTATSPVIPSTPTTATAPSTPSLKIRLPRLNSVSLPQVISSVPVSTLPHNSSPSMSNGKSNESLRRSSRRRAPHSAIPIEIPSESTAAGISPASSNPPNRSRTSSSSGLR